MKSSWIVKIACSALVICMVCLLYIQAGKVVIEEKVLTKREIDQELRGVWVSTVVNLDYPVTPTTSSEQLKYQADTILEDVDESGFNAVFLQVRPCSDAFYKSALYPWSSFLTGQQGTAPDAEFDPLAYWVEKAHERNIELHAWLNPYRIARTQEEWDGLAEASPARQHPDWVIQYGAGYYFDPALPEVRQLVIEGALEIIQNYEVDGIHLDDYFYPGSNFNDSHSYNKYGKDFPDIGDWRRDNVNQLVKNLDEQLHEADPEIEFGISPAAVWASDFMNPEGSATTSDYSSYYVLFADTRGWVREGWVDYLAPQLYWASGEEWSDFTVLLDWWTNVFKEADRDDVELFIGLADYKTVEEGSNPDSPWYGGRELEAQMDACKENTEVGGTMHFRYRFTADSPEIQRVLKEAYPAREQEESEE
ncbi:family 10 glycosylhydrolase [Lachnospiraceae bacterium 56-18]